LWLLANPLWTHGIGESGSKTITGWLLMGAAAANYIWWLNTNPFTGFTAAPQFLSHQTPTFWLLNCFGISIKKYLLDQEVIS
jgi:hypothetical protein